MIKHEIGITVTGAVIIQWELVIEDSRLRLIGSDGINTATVATIYPTGKIYRHANATLKGLVVDKNGRIVECQSSHEVHSQGNVGRTI